MNLVNIEGSTKIYIDVEITNEGELLFSGQDLGEAPRLFYGDSDYEYWLRLSTKEKDRLLLALIQDQYSGDELVISKLRAYLESKGIDYKFDSYA
jgi:hypothetical protein